MDLVSLPAALFLFDWTVRLGLGAHVILRRRPVTASLAWLAIIVLLPFIGAFFYLLIGENRLGSRRLRRYGRLTQRLAEQAQDLWHHEHAATYAPDEHWAHIARFGTAVTGFPPLKGNHLALHVDSEKTIDAIVQDVEKAKSHVHVLTYLWIPSRKTDELVEALLRAARRGVTCRVLVDGVGGKFFFRSDRIDKLRKAGVKVFPALPVNPVRMLLARIDLRNHRKIVVIDGQVAYAGSQNINDSTFRSVKWANTGPWIDATLRIEGPAVQALAVVFLLDWILDSDEAIDNLIDFLPEMSGTGAERKGDSIVQVVPSGPGAAPQAIHQAMLTTLYSAREELVMTTPYFVPDEATKAALEAAAMRGVAVTLVMPHISDSPLVAAASRSHYLDLMEAGVRIRHYEGGLLHAKTITVDRRLALIGSANFDARSFFLNFEVSMFVYDDDFASQIRFMQEGYLSRSREINLHEWRRRPIWRVFADNTVQLLGPLL